jgi:hypothetical protein
VRRAPAPTDEPRAEHKTHVVVRNLPREFDADKITALFAPYGAVAKARMDRGLGRVHFDDEAAATASLELAGTEVEGRVIGVERELRRPRRKRSAKSGAAGGEQAEAEAEDAAPKRQSSATRRVRVEGLTEGTTGDNLKAHFASAGRIQASKVVAGRNHGFVTFEDEAEGALGRGDGRRGVRKRMRAGERAVDCVLGYGAPPHILTP